MILTLGRPNISFHDQPVCERSSTPLVFGRGPALAVRLRADIWVSAYLRRCETEGAFAVLRRRGAPEAGAIFVKIDRLDGSAALYGPAPQSEVQDGQDRLFTRLHREPWIAPLEADAKLAKETRFDPDLWIVETEDRLGRIFFDVAG